MTAARTVRAHRRRCRADYRFMPRRPTTAMASTVTTNAWPHRVEVVLCDLGWRCCIFGVESIRSRPAPGIVTDTVGIENLLCRRHHLVDGVPTSIRGVGVAAQLHSLDFR